MLKVLAYVLIKSVIISSYSPDEDLIELGVGILSGNIRSILKNQSESINQKLKSDFTKDQIKSIKTILAESDDRLIPTSAASVYEHHADELEIAKTIFLTYKTRHEQDHVLDQNDGVEHPFLGNDDNNIEIIKGIAVIIKQAINFVLQSPEYARLLTENQQETSSNVKKLTNWVNSQGQTIALLEEKIERQELDSKKGVDFSSFYKSVLNEFTEKNEDSSAELVGEESPDTSYLDAYIQVDNKSQQALEYLSEWFNKSKHGVLLIYGEPGHGKSSLWKKAVVEYLRERFLKAVATNVLAVSLNIGENPRIIIGGEVNFENILAWGPVREHHFSFEDCRGSLLFMDGFDEFIDDAVKARMPDIASFMKLVGGIAKEYDIHIVVLSRTIAVHKYLREKPLLNTSYALSSLSLDQQNEWLDKHLDSAEYRVIFKNLQKDINMQELLGIPLLFRMIVHTRFDKASSNVIELYDNLFVHLMDKRNVRGNDLEVVNAGLMELAYKIYCNDTDTAVLKEEKRNPNWVFAFYVKALDNQNKYGFFHRSFYQYFLAKHFISELLGLTEDNAETILGHFAEREFDKTVKRYMSLMLNDKNVGALHNSMENIMAALVRTQAIVDYSPKVVKGNAEKTKIGRATNIYRNVFHIANALQYMIQIPFKDGLDSVMRTFDSSSIELCVSDKKVDLTGVDLGRANLSGAKSLGVDMSEANLTRVDLSGADLSYSILEKACLRSADLSESNLNEANLNEAYLRGADLRGANLHGADMKSAFLKGADAMHAKLRKADLRYADMRESHLEGTIFEGANLSHANLSRAHLRFANLSEANLKGAYLKGADLRDANLKGTDLSSACIEGANLEGADMTDAKIQGINWKYVSLDFKYKAIIDRNAPGYDYIQWV